MARRHAEAAPGSLTFLEQDKNGVAGVAGIDAALDLAIASGGTNVYVVGSGSNSVATFTRDPSTGALTWLEQDVDGAGGVDGLSGAWAITVAPDGENVYATGNGDSAVAVFTRDDTTGALTFVEQEKDGVGGVTGLSFATGVAVSPDNGDVYVTGCGDSPYKLVATLTANAQGKYKSKRKVTKKAKYQALVVATPACGAAQSKPVKINS